MLQKYLKITPNLIPKKDIFRFSIAEKHSRSWSSASSVKWEKGTKSYNGWKPWRGTGTCLFHAVYIFFFFRPYCIYFF